MIPTLILFGIRGGKDYYHDEDDYVDIESEWSWFIDVSDWKLDVEVWMVMNYKVWIVVMYQIMNDDNLVDKKV